MSQCNYETKLQGRGTIYYCLKDTGHTDDHEFELKGGDTFTVQNQDTAQRLAALEAAADALANDLQKAQAVINDTILDAEDTRGQVSLGMLITNKTHRKLLEAKRVVDAALAAYRQARAA